MEGNVVAERAHPRWIVANALEGDPERGPYHVAQQRVHPHRGHQTGVVQRVRTGDWVANEPRPRDAADAAEPAQGRHLPEEVEDQQRQRERDHQEVDAIAA